ncbi:Rpn family recombination-promoting nuclease/putative transposase [Chamaesiphon sp. VAR_69_metabat_338]|uniref:Rpn family recombination-promoting nuclease/putative transposase n=1 Tax=Chamaesiphon sp. VAR_69_metabat_338 TaxID=2964704 RepID=UPI00286D7015|nr:Rpn family recombination-promoting nuclease/putative transposase [Chamaesiphon sp. VAR_69_metabat_338]
MRRDSIFYQLFRQYPALLFELLPQLPDRANEYIFESIEVKETAFRIDGVFIPPDPSGIIYICEVQFQLDELLYERMMSEISIYTYRNRERFANWQAVVIYPTRTVEQSRTEMVQELLDTGRIRRIYLDELGKVEELPTGLGLMVLTTLEGDDATTQARGLIDRSLERADIMNLISTIMVYKFSNLSRDEVDAMLGIELQQTRVYQEAKAEGLEIGRQQEKALVIKQLNRKLGNLSPQVQARVLALEIDRIESLGEALLDFTSGADLEAWLSQN